MECSHGCNAVEPVESSCLISRPGRGEGISMRRVVFLTRHFLRPCRGGRVCLQANHGFRSLRDLHPWLHSGAPSERLQFHFAAHKSHSGRLTNSKQNCKSFPRWRGRHGRYCLRAIVLAPNAVNVHPVMEAHRAVACALSRAGLDLNLVMCFDMSKNRSSTASTNPLCGPEIDGPITFLRTN